MPGMNLWWTQCTVFLHNLSIHSYQTISRNHLPFDIFRGDKLAWSGARLLKIEYGHGGIF